LAREEQSNDSHHEVNKEAELEEKLKDEQEVIQNTAESSDQKCEPKRQLRRRKTKPDYVG